VVESLLAVELPANGARGSLRRSGLSGTDRPEADARNGPNAGGSCRCLSRESRHQNNPIPRLRVVDRPIGALGRARLPLQTRNQRLKAAVRWTFLCEEPAARVWRGPENGDEAGMEMALAPCSLSHGDVRQFDIPIGQG
jgi:hypothetical protein